MTRYLGSDPPGLDVLVEMLGRSTKPIAFMIGSALSMPATKGAPGVPGVPGIIQLVQQRANAEHIDTSKLEQKRSNAQPGAQYTTAIKFLLDRLDQDAVNDVIRQAVRLARKDSAADTTSSDEDLEHDLNGWAISRGAEALAELVVRFPEKYRGPIVTTNFDPLMAIAIQLKNGIHHNTILDVDGSLQRSGLENPRQRDIVYLHGYWRGSDTLHTPVQLQMDRPYISASLQQLLRNRMIVVVGYGGWDDIFTKALNSAMFDVYETVDVVWTFYEHEPARIEYQYEQLFANVSPAIGRGRFRPYVGIDCNVFFQELLANEADKASRANESKATAAAPPAEPTTRPPGKRAAAPPAEPTTRPPGKRAAAPPAEPTTRPPGKRAAAPPAEPTTRPARPEAADGPDAAEPGSAQALGPSKRTQILLTLSDSLRQMERFVSELEMRASALDRPGLDLVRDIAADVYMIMTEAFRAGGTLQQEFPIREVFKKSYSDVDDALDMYEYTLGEFDRSYIGERTSLQEQEELIKARRKAIVSINNFHQTISSIADFLGNQGRL